MSALVFKLRPRRGRIDVLLLVSATFVMGFVFHAMIIPPPSVPEPTQIVEGVRGLRIRSGGRIEAGTGEIVLCGPDALLKAYGGDGAKIESVDVWNSEGTGFGVTDTVQALKQ